MKILLVMALAFAAFLMTNARRRAQATNTRAAYDEWRLCVAGNLPSDKTSTYSECYNRTGGTNQEKFRGGLKCVLGSYNLVNGTRVDLRAMQTAATGVTGKLSTAFTNCPTNDQNAVLDRAVKCVIDALETGCPSPNGTAAA